MPSVISDPETRGEYVGQLAAAHQAGLLTWPSVQAAQDAVMPRCTRCGAAPMVDAGTGCCSACYALARYLDLIAQMAALLAERTRTTAEIRRLHAESRPLQQELLKQMTFEQLSAAYDARLRAMTRGETR